MFGPSRLALIITAIADQRTKVSAVYWNTQRAKIYDWMVANGQESFAELYKGAVINLYEKNPGHVRFVAHAVRDLMNGMAACKLGRERPQVPYNDLVQRLNSLWESHGLPRGPETLNPQELGTELGRDLNISNEIAVQIQLLLREHKDGCRRSEESPFLFFQAFLSDPDAHNSLPLAYPKMWKTLRKWFLKQVHENGKLPDKDVIAAIEGKFMQLEEILLSVADRYLNTIKRIDEILDQANS